MKGLIVDEDRLRQVIVDALGRVAPEADPSRLDPRADVREALDIDSFDYMRYLVRVSEALGVDIPDADAARLATLESGVEYLKAKVLRK